MCMSIGIVIGWMLVQYVQILLSYVGLIMNWSNHEIWKKSAANFEPMNLKQSAILLRKKYYFILAK